MDWDDLRYFLSIARHRTLAGAAKDLQVTQSTVGRRLASFEKTMGSRLLQRDTDGFVLTLAGGAILTHAMKVESEAIALQRTIRRHEAQVTGAVRVMSSQLIATHLLASCFADLHARTPEIAIELLPVTKEEAPIAKNVDAAVQMKAFEQDELIVRKLATVAFSLYGSESYLARCGMPHIDDCLAGHHVIVLGDDRDLVAQAEWLSEIGHRAKVVLRSETYETQHQAAVYGGGLAVLPCFSAATEPTLRRLEMFGPVPDAEIWLGVHRAHRNAPRIRIVIDSIANAIRSRATTLNQTQSQNEVVLLLEKPGSSKPRASSVR